MRRSLLEFLMLDLLVLLAALGLFLVQDCAFGGEPGVVILYTTEDSEAVQTACPQGTACVRHRVDRPGCRPFGLHARPHTVILAGHSLPPHEYLGQRAEVVAEAVACLDPDNLVLDTCYGASTPLLEALVAQGATPLVIGSTRKLPPDGLRYDERLFSAEAPRDPGSLVQARSGEPLEVFELQAAALRQVSAEVQSWSVERLEARLRRKLPNLVLAELPGGDATVLVPVPPARFRRQRSSP